VARRKRTRTEAAAQAKVARAIRSGRLTPQPCEVCGHTPAVAHHDSYDRPLDVRWLCRRHHRLHHNEVDHPTYEAQAASNVARWQPRLTELLPLVQRLARAGVTQKETARLLGVAQTTVSEWLHRYGR